MFFYRCVYSLLKHMLENLVCLNCKFIIIKLQNTRPIFWRFRNSKAHVLNSNSISKSVFAYEVQAYSHLWINARKRSGHKLRWLEWFYNPILEC